MVCFENDTHCIYSNIMIIVDKQSLDGSREQPVQTKHVLKRSYIVLHSFTAFNWL
jgi:hypothetical protein